MILEVNNLSKWFGGLVAVNGCSFSVEKGEILGIIGPNGSGKTTLFNLINGILKPDSGRIYFKDEVINKLKPHDRAKKGMGRTFQVPLIFGDMTVLENMLVASFDQKKAYELLDFVGLSKFSNRLAGTLSGGQQKLLELARTLMLNPDLVLLDETMAGLHPHMVQKISEHLNMLHQNGVTLIIVEHNLPFVMNFCERVIVLDSGEIIAEGDPEEVSENERVVEAYLGD